MSSYNSPAAYKPHKFIAQENDWKIGFGRSPTTDFNNRIRADFIALIKLNNFIISPPKMCSSFWLGSGNETVEEMETITI